MYKLFKQQSAHSLDKSDEIGVTIGYTCSLTDKSWKGYFSLCNGLSVESNWRASN